jgi:hypothetical protein
LEQAEQARQLRCKEETELILFLAQALQMEEEAQDLLLSHLQMEQEDLEDLVVEQPQDLV